MAFAGGIGSSPIAAGLITERMPFVYEQSKKGPVIVSNHRPGAQREQISRMQPQFVPPGVALPPGKLPCSPAVVSSHDSSSSSARQIINSSIFFISSSGLFRWAQLRPSSTKKRCAENRADDDSLAGYRVRFAPKFEPVHRRNNRRAGDQWQAKNTVYIL